MLKTARIFQVLPFLAFVGLATLAACSGGSGGSGCGNCTVPAFAPGTGSPGPVFPTPTPTPIPTPAPLSCTQNTTAPNAIVLGPALASFAVLAGSTVTNVGNTFVTYTGTTHDDLVGVSPGSAITGFYPPGTVADGPNSIYAATFNTNTAIPAAAESALITAYNSAAAKPTTVSIAGDLGGLTLTPGVYTSSSTLAIASGNLTLDGLGNPASIFVFQIGTGLTTVLNGSAGGNVILTNSASACNIYWQVGSSAVLGGATFFGNVLALTSITVNATTFTGRALARNGAVSIPVAGGSLITNPGGS